VPDRLGRSIPLSTPFHLRGGIAAAGRDVDHRGAPGSRPVEGRQDAGGGSSQYRKSWLRAIGDARIATAPESRSRYQSDPSHDSSEHRSRTSHRHNTDAVRLGDYEGDDRGDLVRGIWADVVVGGTRAT